jgi:hypothetical protein
MDRTTWADYSLFLGEWIPDDVVNNRYGGVIALRTAAITSLPLAKEGEQT